MKIKIKMSDFTRLLSHGEKASTWRKMSDMPDPGPTEIIETCVTNIPKALRAGLCRI